MVDAFVQWFRNSGGYLNEAIDIAHGPEYGYHCIAKRRAIEVNELACTCPFGLTLSHLNVLPVPPADVRNCFEESMCSALIGHVEQNTIAAFFLVEQRLQGKRSFWSSYIQLLPDITDMMTPLWFNEQELACLNGTNLISSSVTREQSIVELQKASYRKDWESGIAALNDAGYSMEDFTWDLFLWATTIFSSRSFSSSTFLKSHSDVFSVLFPMNDMLNHRCGAKVCWQFDHNTFSVRLEEKIAREEQVFNNYTSKGNEELLMGYGFCVPDNPYDEVAFQLGKVPPAIHQQLREHVPNHWRAKTWDVRESTFYVRGTSHCTSGYSNTYGLAKLNCLRGFPPELVNSVYTIMLANSNSNIICETMGAERIWVGTVNALLQQAEYNLLALTRWNLRRPNDTSTAAENAAFIYRTGQMRILAEVTLELKAFMDPLRRGDVGIETALRD